MQMLGSVLAFSTAIAPDVIDATNGQTPSEQEVHIHHAHWLRVTSDYTKSPEEEYYDKEGPGGLSWVFGTGEEKKQGSIDDRADADLAGPRYGVYLHRGEPQVLIFMLHNKTPDAKHIYINPNVTF